MLALWWAAYFFFENIAYLKHLGQNVHLKVYIYVLEKKYTQTSS